MANKQINKILSNYNFVATKYDKIFNKYSDLIIKEKKTMLEKIRLYYVWQSIKNVKVLPGITCEIGTYKGGTSKFIALIKNELNDTSVHLAIDTYTGHGKKSLSQHDIHTYDNFSDNSYKNVAKYLSNSNINVINKNILDIHPDDIIFSPKIKFIHLDTDLFKPTRYFLLKHYKNVANNGIILIDDFNSKKCPGIVTAFKSFLKHMSNHKFYYYVLPSSQLIIHKIG